MRINRNKRLSFIPIESVGVNFDMHSSHSPKKNSVRDSSHDQPQQLKHIYQTQYLRCLRKLTESESNYYLNIYDEIAKTRTVTPTILAMLAEEARWSPVHAFVKEFIDLVQELELAVSRRDIRTFSTLHARLDDINIAVNAWNNKICLHRSAFLYAQYRQLRQAARSIANN